MFNCLLVKLTRNADISKFIYNGRWTAFDGIGSWSFDNGTARNVVIFGADNSSSSHIDNPKNNFLVLGEGPIEGINGSVGPEEKKISINFTKANIKFCLKVHPTFWDNFLHLKALLKRWKMLFISP